ncbi:hypothetical protein ES695_17405, partial [Candidatus Atribacteria bacterium 1244-E10-H5-B2]
MNLSDCKNLKNNQMSYSLMILLGIVAGSFIGLGSTTRGTDFFGLFFISICCFIFMTILFELNDPVLKKVLIIAFALRTGLALFNAFVLHLPDSTQDAVGFELTGWEYATAWNTGLEANVTISRYATITYTKIIGAIYFISGRVPLIVQFVNVVLGVLIVYYVYKIIIELGATKRSAQIGSAITALFPTLCLYSAITLRGPFTSFFAIVSVFYFFKWLNSGKVSKLVLAATFLLLSSAVFGAMILIGIVYAIFFIFYEAKIKKWRLVSKQSFLGIFIVTLVIVIYGSFLMDKLPANISLVFSPDYMSYKVTVVAEGGAAYLVGFTPNSILDIIIQSPVRMVYFLLAPFPWMISSPGQILGLIDALLYLVLVFYSIRGLKYLKKY